MHPAPNKPAEAASKKRSRPLFDPDLTSTSSSESAESQYPKGYVKAMLPKHKKRLELNKLDKLHTSKPLNRSNSSTASLHSISSESQADTPYSPLSTPSSEEGPESQDLPSSQDRFDILDSPSSSQEAGEEDCSQHPSKPAADLDAKDTKQKGLANSHQAPKRKDKVVKPAAEPLSKKRKCEK